MCKELLSNNSADSCLVPACKTLFIISENIGYSKKVLRIFIFVFLYIILWLSLEALVLATGIDRLCPVKVLGSISWAIT